jgi:hypothetical protein
MANCFVIMPFGPEFNFLYLTIKSHLARTLPEITVERGDDKILTKPILEKIADFIRQADVVIADSTGRNPNVFYELGLAHALEKPVVLITSDAIEEAPPTSGASSSSPTRSSNPMPFSTISIARCTAWSATRSPRCTRRRSTCFDGSVKNLALAPSPQDEFEASLTAIYRRGERLPASERGRAEFLVRRLLGAEPRIEALIALKDWLDGIYP